MNMNLLHSTRDRITSVPTFATAPAEFDLEHMVFLKEFGRLLLRPIRQEDEPRMVEFHKTLSDDSIYFRYFDHISLDARMVHERLAKVCHNTPDSFAIVAERNATSHHAAEIVAVGRLTTTEMPYEAEFAVLMNDSAQNSEFPVEMLKRLIEIARIHGFHTLRGELLVADHDNVTICRSLGFATHTIPEDGIVHVTCVL